MKAIPPTTPPAIAPTLVLLDGGAGTGFAMQVMYEHCSQVAGTSEQIWLFGHEGHVGVVVGHCTHRLKMLRVSMFAAAVRSPPWTQSLLLS